MGNSDMPNVGAIVVKSVNRDLAECTLIPGDILLDYAGTKIKSAAHLESLIQNQVSGQSKGLFGTLSRAQVGLVILRSGRQTACRTDVELIGVEFEDRIDPVAVPERAASPANSKGGLQALFGTLVGHDVKVNCLQPEKFVGCRVLEAAQDCFTLVLDDGMSVHIPYAQVLRILDHPGGTAVIEVFHMVIYKGAIGFSLPIPRLGEN